MLRDSKQAFFDKHLNKADMKTFWKTVRVLNRDYSSRIPTLSDGVKTADSSLDKATILNNYFYTCFNHKIPPLQQLPDQTADYLSPSDCPSDFLSTEESEGIIVGTRHYKIHRSRWYIIKNAKIYIS